MIPEASTHLTISEASEDLITNEPWSIETYAEGLMDDIFTDIDDILDGRRKRPAKTVRTEYPSMQTVTVKMPEVVLPQRVHQAVKALSPSKNQPTSTLILNAPSVTAISPRNEQKNRGLDKLLILGASFGLAIVGTVYLTESGLLTNQLTSQSLPTDQLASPVVIKPDPQAELVNYMLEALAVIDQQGVTNNQTPAKPGFPDVNLNQTNALPLPSTQPVGTLPPPLAANNVPPVPSRTTNVIERIYIPVYQAPQPMRPLPPVPPILPQGSAPNTVQPVAKPIPEKVSTPSVKTPVTAAKPAVNPQPLRILPPKLPTTKATIPTAVIEKAPTTIQQQASLPAYSAELEGLLELGNKSAALFKIDGVTRRVNLGESIGSSGWTLVEVSNGEAIIRRNGEVRSIYAGQKL
ncbi:hypothetical protein [Anabaena lutea]|uniref:Type II secretion system protein GspC N-terminal domain-containing protein n=1 Tax=Anabaena lutea FACHB-196 TaxID=2692881 RepID=A0ABR8FFH2_9NOST|nr:hypothetical protein [Anabaena lutea]MBD2568891.1 hypothetical protein [Anabaena lutea FACHB-196]